MSTEKQSKQAELAKYLAADAARSLEPINITRGTNGEYCISTYTGIRVSTRREDMQRYLNEAFAAQDLYFERSKNG